LVKVRSVVKPGWLDEGPTSVTTWLRPTPAVRPACGRMPARAWFARAMLASYWLRADCQVAS
jgi:hypothetical protein